MTGGVTRNQSKLVLVTRATGYIGGRLVPKLSKAGYQARCLVRDAKLGFLYSYGLYPLRGLIFRNLIRAITGRAEARQVQDALAALAA